MTLSAFESTHYGLISRSRTPGEKARAAGLIPVSPQKSRKSLSGKILSEIKPAKRDRNGTVKISTFLSDKSLLETIGEMSERKKMNFLPIPNIHYRTCSLSKGKVWFIAFYVQDPQTQELRRVRIKVNRARMPGGSTLSCAWAQTGSRSRQSRIPRYCGR